MADKKLYHMAWPADSICNLISDCHVDGKKRRKE